VAEKNSRKREIITPYRLFESKKDYFCSPKIASYEKDISTITAQKKK
jgi:hypothetical protein